MMSSLGWGARSYCSRIRGRRGPSALASSRATMKRAGDLSLSAGPFGAAPRNTRRSISPGREAIDASPAAPPPMLPSDNRHSLCARLAEIADRRQHIQVERCIHRIGVTWPSGLAVAAEVERQDSKSCLREGSSLRSPTLLVEAPPVGKHDTPVTFSVDVSVHSAPVLGRKRDGSLHGRNARRKQHRKNGNEGAHRATLPPL
jgi:hypothetical protein